MRAWLRQHRLALVAATRKWLAQRAAALLNALALGVALALPAGGYALLDGLHGLSTRSAITSGPRPPSDSRRGCAATRAFTGCGSSPARRR